jgi:carnitine monooxygenase subunit
MQQSTQVDIIRRLLKRTECREIELGETERRLPVSDYTDAARFDAECRMIRHLPGIVAHAGQIARPGDFVTKRIMGMPLLILRDQDGYARVFLNVCRHRGSNLVAAASGNGLSRIVCPYHGWTYDIGGELLNVPDKARSFPDLEVKRTGLVSLPSEERHGFIWAVLTPPNGMAATSVHDFLGPVLNDELAAYNFGDRAFYRFETWTGDFNWKCGVEQFLEIYHFAYLHRTSTDYIFNTNAFLCDRFGSHMRVIVPKKSLAKLASVESGDWSLRPNATILYTVFPLSVFFIEKHLLSLLQIYPETADRSRVDVTYVVDGGDVRHQAFWEENIGLFKAAILEDLEMCERMQVGFRSGGCSEVIFGKNETGLQQYRDSLDDALAACGNP